MKFKPHSYQKKIIRFLSHHKRGLLIVDMGLGKTVTSLTAIKKAMFPSNGRPKYRRPLIIAPKIVAENTWAEELSKWDHLKHLKYVELDATSIDHRLKQFDAINDGVITIMSESKIQWLVDMLDKESLEPNGREWPWDAVFIDEISLFKSPKSKRFKNLAKKLQNRCNYVYGLTGTPAPNGLADLWSIMLLIDKGARLGKNKTQFNKRYCYGINIKVDGGNQTITNYKVADEAYNEILEAIGDVSIAMKAEDYLKDRPDVDIVKHYVELPADTYNLIDELTVKRVLELSESEKSAKEQRLERRIDKYSNDPKKVKRVPALVQKLDSIKSDDSIVLRASHIFSLISIGRQLAGGAVYEALPEDGKELPEGRERRVLLNNDAKLQEVINIVKNAEDNVLIFYHFKHEADRLREAFPGAQVLNTDNAQRVLPLWNRGRIKVLLANPASTKFGLNMQEGGHTIVWYGLDYSFEKYVQSNARIARQGQRHPVTVHIVGARDTIDVEIAAAVAEKREVNEYVYSTLSNDVKTEIANAARDKITKQVEQLTGQRVKFVDNVV